MAARGKPPISSAPIARPAGGRQTREPTNYTSFLRTAQKVSAAERGRPRSDPPGGIRRLGRNARLRRRPRRTNNTPSGRRRACLCSGIGPGAAVGLGLGAFALGSVLANPYYHNIITRTAITVTTRLPRLIIRRRGIIRPAELTLARSRANLRSRSRSAVGGYAVSVRQNPLRNIRNLALFSI